MAIFVPFQPSNVTAPRLFLTLDQVYSLTVKWNVSAQRYYFDLYDSAGTWIVTRPLIETGPSSPIVGWLYRPDIKVMQFTSGLPHFRSLGQISEGTIENADPPMLNGWWRYAAISAADRIFPMAQDPGKITQMGSVNHYVNLIRGYIPGWSMIFRNNQLEISRTNGA